MIKTPTKFLRFLALVIVLLTCTENVSAQIVEAEKIGNPEPLPAGIPCAEVDKPSELTYLGRYRVTGYDACEACCGKSDGITASGAVATVGHTVAMKGLPFGTEIYISGLGWFVVEDRGVGEGVIDVFCGSHKDCYALTGNYDVYWWYNRPCQ